MIRNYNSPEIIALAVTIMKCANKTSHKEYLFFISKSYLYLMHVKYFPKKNKSFHKIEIKFEKYEVGLFVTNNQINKMKIDFIKLHSKHNSKKQEESLKNE
jgi:hypothetical protein